MRGALRCGPAPAPGLRQRLQIIGKADIVPAGRIARAGGSSTTTPVPATCAGRWTPALARLGVERLDGFLLHRPDPLLQVDEVAETLNGLVASGKVGWVGLSNAGILHCRALAQCVPLRCNQIELSLQAQHWCGMAACMRCRLPACRCWPVADGRWALR